MGERLLLTLLSVSLSGACLMAAAEGLARLLGDRISPGARRLLWCLVLSRLLCPWSPPGGLLDRAAAGGLPSAPAAAEELLLPSPQISHGMEEEETPIHTFQGGGLPYEGALLLWAAGAWVVLIRYGAGYVRLSRALRRGRRPAGEEARAVYARLTRSCRRAPGLIQCEGIPCPMLTGLLRPAIVLPARPLSQEELEGVLAHELTHWRRRDLWLKWLAVLGAAAHWFNPAAWLLVKRLDRDCELSCDQRVVQHWDAARRARYGELLLALAAGEAYPPAALFSRKKRLKERLIAIMKPKEYGKKAAALGAVACLALVLASTALGAYTGPAAVGEKLADLTQTEAAPTPETLAWPLEVGDSVELSSLFQGRVHPVTGEKSQHDGIDIPWEEGAPVLAAADGAVVAVGYSFEYGNCVILQHGDMVTRYECLKEYQVEPGERVSAGEQIGQVGSTGMSTGPHLHFMVTVDGEAVDSLELLDGSVAVQLAR